MKFFITLPRFSGMRAAAVATAVSALLASGLAQAQAERWFPYQAEVTEPAFAADGTRTPFEYVPLEKAERKVDLCVSFPHLKDAYWLGVDYGIVEEARRLGATVQVLDAGGYTNLGRQISQIEDCIARGVSAIIVGAISADGLGNVIKNAAAKGIPVIDAINGINSPDLAAKSLVSFYTMGASAGEYLARLHPAGSPAVKVGWFPGPAGAGWVEAAHQGFNAAVQGSAIELLPPKYGDTGKEVQAKLVEDVLQAHPDLAYIAGTAVTAEAATGILRARQLGGKVKVLAFYMTPGVYEGIQRGRIMAAPADSMVIQGRIAVDQAVRLAEGKPVTRHVGPKIFMVDQDNLASVRMSDILPPKDFKPVFQVR